MIGFMFFVTIVAVFAALGLAAMRWGVDSRTWTPDGRTMSIFRR